MRTPEEIRMSGLLKLKADVEKVMRPPRLRIVTPEWATELMANLREAEDNGDIVPRDPKKMRIERLARQAVHDLWIPSHQGVALENIKGKKVPMDGCHRLEMIPLAGVPVLMWVWEDVPRTITTVSGNEVNMMEITDHGTPRNNANGLQMNYGFDNSSKWASHLTGIVEFMVGHIPPPEVHEIKKVYDMYRKHSEAILGVYPSACFRDTKLWSILALYHAANPDNAVQLATNVLTKSGTFAKGDAAHTLNLFLDHKRNNAIRPKGGYSSIVTYMNYIATACAAHSEGKDITRLSAREDAREWLRDAQGAKRRTLETMFARVEYTNVAAETKK